MIETLDASLVFNSVLSGVFGLVIFFAKNWKQELAAQLNELYDDIKKLREDIFSISLKEESRKGTYYTLFARTDDVRAMKQKIDTLQERIIKLESVTATSLTRRAGDFSNVAVVSPVA